MLVKDVFNDVCLLFLLKQSAIVIIYAVDYSVSPRSLTLSIKFVVLIAVLLCLLIMDFSFDSWIQELGLSENGLKCVVKAELTDLKAQVL